MDNTANNENINNVFLNQILSILESMNHINHMNPMNPNDNLEEKEEKEEKIGDDDYKDMPELEDILPVPAHNHTDHINHTNHINLNQFIVNGLDVINGINSLSSINQNTFFGVVQSIFTDYDIKDIEDIGNLYDMYNYTIYINDDDDAYDVYNSYDDDVKEEKENAIDLESYGSIHTIENGEEKECSICFEPFNDIYFSTTCHHTFHKDCITPWLSKKKNCPVCRHSFD